ncbi:hypothetical protein RND81_14G103800 [Saponaria officinalis]|uniref:WRKY domain-containing protein n=1 Tax=Saponaria officinalis TaxID=3572 RepID=A0AAW1GKI7_SAPOF
MENNSIDPTNQKGLLVDELVEGRDLTKELYSILLRETSSSSNNKEAHSLRVTQEILSKIERSLTILRYDPTMHTQCTTMGAIDSPISFNGTPKSPDSSEGDLKDPIVDCKDDSRKRKVIPRCTIKVEGCCKSGLEGPVDDGCSWRKYGQKDILGTNFPRAYYRCTQRSQGCFATKQVQRSDDDPTYFEVTYRGKHTCYQSSSSSSSMPHLVPKLEPNNPSPIPQPQILWNFGNDSKEIKPNVTTTNTNSSSFGPSHMLSNHLGPTQFTQNSMLNNHNYNFDNNNNNDDANLFSTRIRDESMNDYHDHTNNPLNVTSDFSFDQEKLESDFIFDNRHLFQ